MYGGCSAQKLEKWAALEAVGGPVAPTNFIPCKTPLSAEILANWSLPQPAEHPLTVASLLEGQAAAGRRVGMILDLSNHATLYRQDLTDGLGYEHVQVRQRPLWLFPRVLGLWRSCCASSAEVRRAHGPAAV